MEEPNATPKTDISGTAFFHKGDLHLDENNTTEDNDMITSFIKDVVAESYASVRIPKKDVKSIQVVDGHLGIEMSNGHMSWVKTECSLIIETEHIVIQ